MEINLTSGKDPFVILLLSDTHITGPRGLLPEPFLDEFRHAGPDLILHCGDICTMNLIKQLQTVAPVYEVRGNRDIFNWFRLPADIDLTVNSFRIHIEHGQGNLLRYLRTKSYITLCRLFSKRPDYRSVVLIKENYRDYDLYCFGHSHEISVESRDGTILINPGHMDLGVPDRDHPFASFCLIFIGPDSVTVQENYVEKDGIRRTIKEFPRLRM